MISLWIETKVKGQPEVIFDRFDEQLFKALKPPGMTLDVLRFDGCQIGDQIHLCVGLLGITQPWVSVITEVKRDPQECYFVDEGRKLPTPFFTWRHAHRIRKFDDQHSLIIEDIQYTCRPQFLEKVLSPLLKFQFSLRSSVYLKFFS